MPIVMFSEVLLCCSISKREEGGEGEELLCATSTLCRSAKRALNLLATIEAELR